MKILIVIDIAKLNHFAAAISLDGEILIKPFKFTNNADGFQLLVSKLESFDKNSIIIGSPSTAHYILLLRSTKCMCVEPHQNLSNA